MLEAYQNGYLRSDMVRGVCADVQRSWVEFCRGKPGLWQTRDRQTEISPSVAGTPLIERLDSAQYGYISSITFPVLWRKSRLVG